MKRIFRFMWRSVTFLTPKIVENSVQIDKRG